MKTQICTKCGIEKELTDFHVDNCRKSGFRTDCKLCMKEYRKIFYQTNHKKVDKRNKKYFKEHREEGLKYRKDYYRSHKKEAKDLDLKKRFGISLDQYNKILESQNGVCAVCGNEEIITYKNYNTGRSLAVDHNHETGKVRGLLCTGCNRGIGFFNNNPERLIKASNYLKNDLG